MGSSEGISVAAERAVHNAIRDLAERLWAQHAIRLDSCDIDWVDVSTPGKADYVLTNIRVSTTTRK